MSAAQTSLRGFLPGAFAEPSPAPRRPRAASAPKRLAVRVDDPPAQLPLGLAATSPELFVHEGARQSLERRLAALLRERVLLSITDNRRTMISSSRSDGLLRIRLHHMFLDMDAPTCRALAQYLTRPDRSASLQLTAYIERNGHRIRPERRRRQKMRTEGEHHDLKALFDDLNARYFGGTVDAHITWGRRPSTRRRRRVSIRLGAYSAGDKLIRIHPVLDQPWVPAFFVAFIVYHEMLHHVIPAPIRHGKQCFHTAEFRSYERAYPDYAKAIRWEERNIHRLLAL